MSVSHDQATDAAVFLTLYKEAIETIEQSAEREASNEAMEEFTDRVIKVTKNKQFRKYCNPREPLGSLKFSPYFQLLTDVRAFQFSHYVFCKYLPQFLKFPGTSSELINYMKEQSFVLEKDLSK